MYICVCARCCLIDRRRGKGGGGDCVGAGGAHTERDDDDDVCADVRATRCRCCTHARNCMLAYEVSASCACVRVGLHVRNDSTWDGRDGAVSRDRYYGIWIMVNGPDYSTIVRS